MTTMNKMMVKENTVMNREYKVTYTTVDGKERELIWKVENEKGINEEVIETIDNFVKYEKWPETKRKCYLVYGFDTVAVPGYAAHVFYDKIASKVASSIAMECVKNPEFEKAVYKAAGIKAKHFDEIQLYRTLGHSSSVVPASSSIDNRCNLKKAKQRVRYYRENWNDYEAAYQISKIIEEFGLYNIVGFECCEEITKEEKEIIEMKEIKRCPICGNEIKEEDMRFGNGEVDLCFECAVGIYGMVKEGIDTEEFDDEIYEAAVLIVPELETMYGAVCKYQCDMDFTVGINDEVECILGEDTYRGIVLQKLC